MGIRLYNVSPTLDDPSKFGTKAAVWVSELRLSGWVETEKGNVYGNLDLGGRARVGGMTDVHDAKMKWVRSIDQIVLRSRGLCRRGVRSGDSMSWTLLEMSQTPNIRTGNFLLISLRRIFRKICWGEVM